jgi:hypothetical protein
VIICHKLFVGWVFCCVWAAFGLCSAGGTVLCLLVLSLELWVEAWPCVLAPPDGILVFVGVVAGATELWI